MKIEVPPTSAPFPERFRIVMDAFKPFSLVLEFYLQRQLDLLQLPENTLLGSTALNVEPSRTFRRSSIMIVAE